MADADHKCLVCYSRDGGRNWSNWKEFDLGAVGEYERRVKLKQLGIGRSWIFKVRVSSPRKHELLGAVVTVERTDG